MSIRIKEYLEWLGHPARDRVTGYTGVVSSISFDLYGCVQAVLTPSHKPDGKKDDADFGRYFDIKRLEKTDDNRVMAPPNFELPEIGAAEKPRLTMR